MIPFRLSVCVGLVMAGAALPAAAAEEQLEEVIVTASLAQTPLAKLPASVTVLNAAQLDAAGQTHFGDALSEVPNLGFAGGTSRPRYFQIRGIGETEQYEGAPNPSVGFLIDDIDFSGIAMPAALFDVRQAEILRGPQGTTYGANAIAGLISLTSQAPQPGFQLHGELEGADYGTRGGGLVLNDSTSSGDTAWRLALHRDVSDGFRYNEYLHRDDTNGYDENLARLRVSSRLADTLQMNLTALYSDVNNGYDAWSIDNSRVTQSDQPGVDAQLSKAAALHFDYSGWQGVTLRSISTFARANINYSYDGDWGNDVMWGVNGPYDFFEDITRQRRNITQEFRLLGQLANQGDWVAGVYGLRMDERYHILDTYDGDVYRLLNSNYRALTLAAYGQVDQPLGHDLSLSAGLRVERRTAHYRDSNDLAATPVDNMIGGHLALSWQWSDRRSLYVSLTRGYKAGGINTTTADIPDDRRGFDPEFVWNLETGLTTRSADGRFDSRTSIFYMLRRDQQVSSSLQTDPTNPLDFVLLTDNAARGDNLGVESELGWRPLPAWRFSASIALLQARFRHYLTTDPNTGEPLDLDGRDDPYAPNYQLGLSAQWHDPRGWFAEVQGQAVDAYYFSASNNERAPAHRLVNLRLGYAHGRWQVTAWSRNLLNENYDLHGFYFANEPPDWIPKRYVQLGDPRQVGLRVDFSL